MCTFLIKRCTILIKISASQSFVWSCRFIAFQRLESPNFRYFKDSLTEKMSRVSRSYLEMQNDRKYTYLKILEPLIKNVHLEQQSSELRSDTLIKNVHFANHLTKIFDQKCTPIEWDLWSKMYTLLVCSANSVPTVWSKMYT